MEFINKNKGLVVMIIGLLALIIYNWNTIHSSTIPSADNLEANLIEPISTEDSNEESNQIVIEIKGEVNYPGIYELPKNSRIADAILISGGLTKYADISGLNQAVKMTDEQLIIIPTSTIESTSIQVEIKGEVHHPGVYILYTNSRTEDLIEAAGGLTSSAEIADISLARILIDGESVTIPKKETIEIIEPLIIYVEITGQVINPGVYQIPNTYTLEELIEVAGGVTNQCDLSKIIWDLKLLQGATIHIYSYEEEMVINNDLININKAGLSELDSLPGIGEILAQRIIDYRKEFGDFSTIEDIMLVTGIKFTIYEDIKELITV